MDVRCLHYYRRSGKNFLKIVSFSRFGLPFESILSYLINSALKISSRKQLRSTASFNSCRV